MGMTTATPDAHRIRGGRGALREVEAICRDQSGMDLLGEVTGVLARVVPYDAAFWSAVDPLTCIPTSPALVENHPAAACTPYWHVEHHTEDDLQFDVLARSRRPWGSLHDLTGGDIASSSRYQDLHRQFGMEDELRVAMLAGGACWGAVSLSRAAGERPFSADEQAYVAAVSDLLGSTMRKLSTERMAQSVVGLGTPGIATVDPDGAVLHANEEFHAWLEEIPTHHGDAHGGLRSMPTELNSLVQRVLAVRPGDTSSSARARVRTRSGQWLSVHTSLMLPDTVAPLVAVVIEAAPKSEVAAIMATAFALTPREREVAARVARGLGTDEIAADLFLSPHTVRDHLKALFEKVGVNSRGELVATLFATMWQEDREVRHVSR